MVLRISFLVATLVTFRGLSPSMVKLSSFLKFLKEALRKIRTPHIYFFSEKIRFALYRFRSPLITVSLLISLPPGTKMFQFPGFPLLSECMNRKSHSEIFGSTAPCTSPRHIAAWHVLHRFSNQNHPPSSLYDTQSISLNYPASSVIK